MKKLTILILVIILTSLVIAIPQILYSANTIPYGNCGDTDADANPNTQFKNKGSVAGKFQGDFHQNGTNQTQTISGVFTDYCRNSTTLVEFTCGSSFGQQYSNLAGSLQFDCTELGNYSCVQGHCENIPIGEDWPVLALWHFNEGTGNITADSSGNGVFGTLLNGTNWTQGIEGNAVIFDGNNSIVQISNEVDLNNGFEITAKIKRISNPNNPNGPVAQNYGIVVRQKGSFYLGIYNQQVAGAIKLCGSQFPGCGTPNQNWVSLSGGPQINLNEWHTLKLIKNQTHYMLYLDNQLINPTMTNNVQIGPATGDLTIGGGNWEPGSPYLYNTFNGIIDEVSIRGY